MRQQINLQQISSHMTINEAFEQFIRVKKNQNVSGETIIYYEGVKKGFTNFFSGENSCIDITKRTIEDYTHFLKCKKPAISSVTVNTNLRGLRAILYFFMAQGYLEEFKISLIRQEKAVKRTYTEYELDALLKKPNLKKCDFAEYRNWVISNYLLATGNRLSTVCNVKIRDINFKHHEILLTKLKNRRQYIIPLSSTLEKILIDYLQYRKGEQDDYLFCTRYGDKLEKAAIVSAIKRYNRKRGVEKTSIHLYRHTFAKNWILNGGDIARLKSILGHSSNDIVHEYLEMFGGDLQRNFDLYNPLDNIAATRADGRKSIAMKK
ncbi:MAG: site-specific integrase [Eubacterium sp.]|jgi:integrase/recombinase XerD|nr:site-specific integrase [Eubacterium sp.]